jgi:hypothetical protein
MEQLTSGQIKQEYGKGRRNFDGIKANQQDFHGFNLKGCSFKKVDLSWSLFDTGDLSNCDFTEANLMWSGLRQVNLENTKFINANVSYCDFSGSTFKNTDFKNSDLTASLLFNVNMGDANIQGANMSWTATSIMQLTEEGMRFAIEKLKQLGRQIPPDLLIQMELLTKKIHEKQAQLAEMKLAYVTPGTSKKEGSTYSPNISSAEKEISYLRDELGRLYTSAFQYGSGVKGGTSSSPRYVKK